MNRAFCFSFDAVAYAVLRSLRMNIVVDAFWDDETKVWVAAARDEIGIATEAETMEALQQKLATMVPDMLGDDHRGPFEIELIARSHQTVAAA
jgi:hypothetical protein